jgi:pyridoxine 4-dehydrogenase
MSLSGTYGPSDDKAAEALLRRAVERGVDHFDSSDMYGWGHNEELLGRALAKLPGTQRDKIVIATKFGQTRQPGGANGVDGSPAYVQQACEASLKRLGIDMIDLYYQHRVDPNVPVEETVGAMSRLVEQGKVRHLGLCEAHPERIRRAHAVHPIADLQIEYSLIERGIERDILTTCRELGIGITAYGVLARGLISGHWSKDSGKTGKDYRLMTPRFQGPNLDANLALVEQLRAIAAEIGATPAQVAIAWVAAQGQEHGQQIVPLVGARTRNRLSEALGAAKVTLTPAHLAVLAKAFPPDVAAGTRYAAEQMAHLDSEKPATA